MRGRRGMISLAWILALFFMLSSGNVMAKTWQDLFPQAKPMTEKAPPKLKMMTRISSIAASVTEQNLRCPRGSYESLSPLYDGQEETIGGGEEPLWVTLDLGRNARLAGVRFLPSPGEGVLVNRCIGTQFLASKDNKTFVPVGKIQPDGEGDLSAEWEEILFGTSGEYRYLRAELPAHARFGEMVWLEYPDWHYEGRGNQAELTMMMTGFDHSVDLDTTVLAMVYNREGIMKRVVRSEQFFPRNRATGMTIRVPGLKREAGDSCRVLVLEKGGEPVLSRPLEYYDHDGSQSFSMSNVFSDHMLLQAEKPLTVWGKAPTGSRVVVTLENHKGGKVERETAVKENSDWMVDLGSFSPGGTYRMTVRCGSQKNVYEDITFGDVWLCVGQSNMDYYMLGGQDTVDYLDSEEGRTEAENPNIRLVNLWNKGLGGAGAAVEELPLGYGAEAWAPMTRDTANYCSAVGYFFAQALEQQYRVPIGILSAAVGDTEINRWLPEGKYGSFTATDGGLFYNRVAPFARLQIRGILMYQGEADQYRTGLTTTEYRDAMVGVVDHYRSIWGEDLPFYWAQLTRYKKDESAVREGQRLALAGIRNPHNAGVVSLMDLFGEYEEGQGNCREDIHPHQKREVAERFLLYARRDIYEKERNVTASGPTYQSMQVMGNKLELTFSSQGDLAVLPPSRYADRRGEELIRQHGLDTKALQEFEIAGEDGVFVRAEAEIRGNQVILSSKQVPNPRAARYAWGAYPEMPNLTDQSGLPALTFTTQKAEEIEK